MMNRWIMLIATALLATVLLFVFADADQTMQRRTTVPWSQDIALYEKRAAEDPWSAADRAELARLYLQRARELGDYEDFRRGESAARAALSLRAARNQKAQLALASSLLAQHRFVEARVAAEQLVRDDPTGTGGRALLAEIVLELGDYAKADTLFLELTPFEENLAVAPRLARWHEINGRDDTAGGILRRAAAAAHVRADLPAEQIAWFELRIADFAVRHDQLSEAKRAIERGLSARPDDARLLSAAARLAAARAKWKQALALVQRVGDAADLATLALGGDAAGALGRNELAETFYARVEASYRANPEPFARQWTQFNLDHGRNRAETLAILEAEYRIRPDKLGRELLDRAYRMR